VKFEFGGVLDNPELTFDEVELTFSEDDGFVTVADEFEVLSIVCGN
jgi:hypothetical protein